MANFKKPSSSCISNTTPEVVVPKLRMDLETGSQTEAAPTHTYSKKYVRLLEKDLRSKNRALHSLASEHTRIRFTLRQILEGSPLERCMLLRKLKSFAYESDNESVESLPEMYATENITDSHKLCQKQLAIISQLRDLWHDLAQVSLERYPLPLELVNQYEEIHCTKRKLFQNIRYKLMKIDSLKVPQNCSMYVPTKKNKTK